MCSLVLLTMAHRFIGNKQNNMLQGIMLICYTDCSRL